MQGLKNLGKAALVCLKNCEGVARHGRSIIFAAVPVKVRSLVDKQELS